ncbi:hypothetical protein F8S09_14720 [Deinococcus sp. SDU3-2]|uniref:Uncharacterized protein n=1 Tax=Deinococcus terrestris TaxID=2651870 RepID=A0A7X1TSX3_9DEIO|nr:hypothetical protein [Deinococcus terrestris]MPY67914.1 hypothetical protein [Deinococcus terrestris]
MTPERTEDRQWALITALLAQVDALEGQWPAQRLHDLRRTLRTADQALDVHGEPEEAAMILSEVPWPPALESALMALHADLLGP